MRDDGGRPTWLEVVISGDSPEPPPVEPPPPVDNFDDLKKALRAVLPQDYQAAQALAAGYEGVINSAPTSVVSAQVAFRRARAQAFSKVPPSLDWVPFLNALDSWFGTNIKGDISKYLAGMTAVVSVLREVPASVLEFQGLQSPGPGWVWVQDCSNGFCQGYWRKSN